LSKDLKRVLIRPEVGNVQADILDPELYRTGDPHAVYAWLRREAPLYRDGKNDFWVASRYAEVVHVSKHPETFCSQHGVVPGSNTKVSMVTMDEPRHGRLRRLVNRGFTPRMVGMLEPRIRETVEASLDAVAEKGACDFVKDLAVPLPMIIIAELLGIRPEDRDRFEQWSDTMIAAGGGRAEADPQIAAAAGVAFGQYAAYLQGVFEDRRRQPREDLVSILVQAQGAGTLAADEERLEGDELLMFMTLLLVAGNETTRNAIAGGMLALIENPAERAKLLADPGLVPSAVEEILRWVSPVVCFYRTATRDAELRGERIREGERVVMIYPSANRDEDVFPEADRFRVDRRPNPHIAFGIGNHFCLGANLARLELRIFFEGLLRRLPDVELAPGARPSYTDSPFVRGMAKMPVVFTPEER
jgi:cytochrome P450 family 142 subfamily A polypeptide 1